MQNKKTGIKEWTISIISFVFFCIIMFYIFMDGIGNKGSHGVSGFIEQDNLRKSLGDWYQLVFYTFQVNLYFVIIGMSWAFLHNNRIVQNLFFCSICFLLFCLFAMYVFEFKSFKTNAYESSKTLFVHCIIPLSSFVILWFVRKEICLEWKWLWINSLYITFYVILSVGIYYTHNFTEDSQYPNQHLWIYGFLDYDNQIMFVPLPGLGLTVFGIIVTILISPLIGMVLFIFIKWIFNLKIKSSHYHNENVWS